jgi:vancomycin resistance protein YoaR
VDRKKLGRRMRRLARTARIPSRDAQIHFDGRSFVISDEQSGRAVDTDATEKNLVRYFDPLVKRRVALVAGIEQPRIHAAELRLIDGRLTAPFTTHFNPGDANRTQNLRLAAEAED